MFEIPDIIRYIVQIKSPLTDESHPVKNFFMIDNIFNSVYVVFDSNDKILNLFQLFGFCTK